MDECKMSSSGRAPPLGKSIISKLYFWKDVGRIIILTVYIVLMAVIRKVLPGRQKDLTGKVILITGTGNGLGKELALQLATLKASLACIDIAENDNLDTVTKANDILNGKGSAKAYTCDVSDYNQVKRTAEQVLKDFGCVDILINNAALIYIQNITEGSEEIIEKVFKVNLFSTFWMVRSFLPSMKERNEGHIVFMNTVSAIHAVSHCCAYSASKFGMLGFMHALEEELRSDPSTSNIKLTSAHPYFVSLNKEILQFWNSRIAPLDLKNTVAEVITGIRKESRTFTVPGSDIGYWMLTLSRLVPLKLYRLYRDIFYADISVLKNGHLSLTDMAKHAEDIQKDEINLTQMS